MVKHRSYMIDQHSPKPSWQLPSRLGQSPADKGPAHRRRSFCMPGGGWAESYQSQELERSCKAASRCTLVMGLEDGQWAKEDSVRGMERKRAEKRYPDERQSRVSGCRPTSVPGTLPCHLAQVHSLVHCYRLTGTDSGFRSNSHGLRRWVRGWQACRMRT